jgi:hypothetical protein
VSSAPTSLDLLDELLAKQSLHELMAAYCRAVDRADEKALRDLFHPEAIVEGGVVNGAAAAFASGVASWLRSNAPVAFHTITNEYFEVSGDHAIGECYVLAINTTRGDAGDTDTITAGRYLDRFERRGGQWKFIEHTFVMDSNINQPGSAVFDDAIHPPGRMRGAYSPDDPSAAFWRSSRARGTP